MIFISFALTGILIYKLISESQKNPVVIYTDQNVIPVQDINFPAVTMCFGLIYKTACRTIFDYDEVKLSLENGTKRIENFILNELKMLQVTSLIARDGFVSEKFPDLKVPTDDFMDILDIFNETLGDNSKVDESFGGHWIKQYFVDARKILTEFGDCYTFNYPDSDRIYTDET